MKCTKCGKELEEGAQFCQFCGEKQGADVPKGNEKKESTLSDKAVYLIGAALGVVIVLIVIMVKAGSHTSNDSQPVEAVMSEVSSEIMMAQQDAAVGMNETEAMAAEETVSETETETEVIEEVPESVEKLTAQYVRWGDGGYGGGRGGYYEFDKDGDIISCFFDTSYDSSYGYQMTEQLQYLTDADGNKVNGTEISRYLMGYVGSTYEYSFARHHLIQKIDIFTKYSAVGVGESNDTIEFRYDEKNRLIGIINGEWDTEWTFSYQESGGQTVISAKRISSDGTFDSDEIIIIDDKGRLISKHEYRDGHEISYDYEYDENGNLSRDNLGEYEYDEKGNKVRAKSSNGSELWEYDEEGRLICDTEYWNSGFIDDTVMHERVSEYQYDEHGKLERCSRKRTEDSQTKDEYVAEYAYNERGQMTEVRLNGIVIGTIEYTDGGMPSKMYGCEDDEKLNLSSGDSISNYYEKEFLYDVLPDNIKYTDIMGNMEMLVSFLSDDLTFEYWQE